MANTPARGHNTGETVAMQPGFYDPKLHSVILVEKPDPSPGEVESQTKHGQGGVHDYGGYRPSFDADVATHELGHALDYGMAQKLSQSEEFGTAARAGYNRLSALEKQQMRYYLDTPAGREELMAELFRISHSKHLNASDLRMKERFKEVVDEIQKSGL